MSKVSGIIGVFKDSHDLVDAAKAGREKMGFKKYDAFTPYAVHGLDDAMGIKRSWLPYATFTAGLTGLMSAAALEIWTSAVDWPINIGGKPLVSFPAFVPIMFELTVLLGGLTTVGALFYACGLPGLGKKILHPRITNDRFILWVPSEETGFNENTITQFMKTHKAEEISVVTE